MASTPRLPPLLSLIARITLALLAALALRAHAAEQADALSAYLNGLNTLSAQFTQTVTDAHGLQSEAGSGSLQVQRPNRFRWDYRPGSSSGASGDSSSSAAPSLDAGGESSGQLMVADGKNLWFYDRELAQVTVKPITTALSSTPILLLSSSPEQLHATFELSSTGSRDGLVWVQVKPRSATADFSTAELGFEGPRLARMLVHDNLGQTVRLDFQHAERNASLPASMFDFKPPKDVDVIGTPH